MRNFEHYISLGHFCSVAMDLEALGLRDASLPFDWNIELDFKGVLNCIRNRFQDYLTYEKLEQDRNAPAHYKNEYNVQFFHDFNPYAPLSEQLPAVEEKYARRIARFYEEIAEPTLFIRYINTQILDEGGRSRELIWIEEHEADILAFLKSFHPDNEILYIVNDTQSSETVRLYRVPADKGDIVARQPRLASKELGELLSSFTIRNQKENAARGREAARHRKKNDLQHKLEKVSDKLLHRSYYRHHKQYE